jgi:hypothetical protein
MKRMFFTLCALVWTSAISAQVYSYMFDNKNAFATFTQLIPPNESMPVILMPPLNVDSLLEVDARPRKGVTTAGPYRFGYAFDVDYNLGDGKWVEDGERRVWSLRFYSERAYSLNFGFSSLKLSPEAELYLFSSDGSMVFGPVTPYNAVLSGYFGTDLLKGPDVVIQLIEPSAAAEKSDLSISRVVHGYKNTFATNNPAMDFIRYYAVYTEGGKRLSVAPLGVDESVAVADSSGTIAYTLYNQSTGAEAASGRVPANGGALDFTSVANGVYLLRLELGGDTFDTHRVMLR